MNDYHTYYQNKLHEALEYQDFVAEELYKVGLPLFNYASKKYQYEHGENKLGIEIKHDQKFFLTGNLWIEVAEKSHPQNECYVASGIQRKDNSWLYVIGDYSIIFIFSKNLLKILMETGKYEIRENNTRTSKGFLLSGTEGKKYAARIIELNTSRER